MNEIPTARTDGLVVEHLDGETLVYDTQTNTAHALDAHSAQIWGKCDGLRDVETIADELNLVPAVVKGGVLRLAEQDLVIIDISAHTRRSMLRTLASGAAAGVALPVVVSMAAPTAAMAASPGPLPSGSPCTADGQCASGKCFVNGINVGTCK